MAKRKSKASVGKKGKMTKYQKYVKSVKTYCNTGSAASRKRKTAAKKAYIEDAVKKGKTKTEATAIANRVDKCKN